MEPTPNRIANNKRKRSENWDASDKILLQQLIEEKINVIEDKNVDTNTSKVKREAWKEILNLFNKCSNTKRDVPQIQCQWRNTKMQTKKRVSAYRREREATGGGPPPKSPDPNDERLMNLIPGEFDFDTNKFDSDATNRKDEINEDDTFEGVEYLVEEVEEKEEKDIVVPSNENTKPEGKNSCNMSQTGKKSIKKSKSRNNKPHNSMARSDDNLKVRYLEVAIEAKNAEVQHIQKKLEEEIENIVLERSLKRKSYEADERRKEDEHYLKTEAYKADEKRKEEEHQVKLLYILEEHELRKERIRQMRL